MRLFLVLLAVIALFATFAPLTRAGLLGTASTQFDYTVTNEDLEAYRSQIEFDVYNLQSSSGHCEPFSQSICSELIPFGTSIFVPDSSSQFELSQQLERALFLLRVAKQEDECDLALFSFLCSKFFLLCTIDSPAGSSGSDVAALAVANPPCYPICKKFNESCPELVERFVLIPQDLRPICADSTDAKCGYHIDAQARSFAAPQQQCPSPLVDVNDPTISILSGSCAEPCPILMWSHSEYQRMDIMSEVLGIISLLSSLFITLTWLVFPKMRQKQYIFFFFVCSFFLSLFLWIGLRIRGSDIAASIHCKSPTKEYQMEGYCLFQGMTTIYFLIAGTAWWMIQATDIFLKVVLEVRFIDGAPLTKAKEVGYHVFAWGFGALCTIGALAYEQIGGYNNGASFCLFSTERGVNKTPDVSYGFFYYPLIVMTALGVLAIAATFIKLLLYKFSTKSGIGVSSFVRIFILVLAMLGVCIIIVLYKFMAADKVNVWRESSEEFYQCLLFARDNPYEDIDCGSSPKKRMPIGLKFLYDLIPLAPGLLAFICYGFTKALYTSWLGLFYDKCGVKCGKKYSAKENHSNSHHSDVSKADRSSHASVTSKTAAPSTSAAPAQTQANSAKSKMFNQRRPGAGATTATSRANAPGQSTVQASTTEQYPTARAASTVEMNDM